MARGQNRALLVMATGTGKTYTAFQIIWRLWKSGAKKRILFLADRNILIAVSYTHLDVYKRQFQGCARSLERREAMRAIASQQYVSQCIRAATCASTLERYLTRGRVQPRVSLRCSTRVLQYSGLTDGAFGLQRRWSRSSWCKPLTAHRPALRLQVEILKLSADMVVRCEPL